MQADAAIPDAPQGSMWGPLGDIGAGSVSDVMAAHDNIGKAEIRTTGGLRHESPRGFGSDRTRHVRPKPSSRHAGARPQAESLESITLVRSIDPGLASASLRRPEMTRLTKVDTLASRILTQADQT